MVALISLAGGLAGYALFGWFRRGRDVARSGSYLLMAAAAAILAANLSGENSALAGIAGSVLLITACVILIRARQTSP
jgi:hypothetical protein